eukprot:3362312-Pyramimonas_sp.AAC.1
MLHASSQRLWAGSRTQHHMEVPRWPGWAKDRPRRYPAQHVPPGFRKGSPVRPRWPWAPLWTI